MTFDLDRVLNPLIDRAVEEVSEDLPLAIECVVRWNPAKRCLPELVIDAERTARLAASKSRLELRLLPRDDVTGTQPRKVPPSIGVEFNIAGAGFDPQDLTDMIGIEPDATSRMSPTRPKRRDTWTMGGGRVRAMQFQPLLDQLLAELAPKADLIRAFCFAHQAEATFAFVAEVVNEAPYLVMTGVEFEQLAALHASIWFDPYCRDQL